VLAVISIVRSIDEELDPRKVRNEIFCLSELKGGKKYARRISVGR
jgi:hypothetical protein